MTDLKERLRDRDTLYSSTAPALRLEAADRIEQLEAENKRLREALDRQCDSMAFVLNHAELPEQWYITLSGYLEGDRQALEQSNG